MKCRGSITIFLALCIGFFLAAVFAILELTRFSCLKSNARMSTLQASDSLLAEYQPELWKDYNVLFWEAGEGSGTAALEDAAVRQQEFVSENYDSEKQLLKKDNYYLLGVSLPEVTVDSYELATDHKGAPFRKQASMAFSDVLSESVTDHIKDAATTTKSGETKLKEAEKQGKTSLSSMKKDIKKDEQELKELREERRKVSQENDKKIKAYAVKTKKNKENAGKTKKEKTEAEKKAEEAEKAREKEEKEKAKAAEKKAKEKEKNKKEEIRKKKEIAEDNPIAWMTSESKKGVLSLVLPGEEFSDAKIETEDLTSHRKLQEGNFSTVSTTAKENIQFYYYLQKRFACFTSEEKNGDLEYEQEYMIGGKEYDIANLKAVVRRLLLMREATNYLYLQKDPAKNAAAEAIADAIVLVFKVVPKEPLKQGILAAWAYAESICDVRILLSGGKVSLVKTSAEWQTSIKNLSKSGKVSWDKRNKTGLTYQQYLMILLCNRNIGKTTYRSMDLIEAREGVLMDSMVSQMTCSYRYEAPPVFWNFITLGNHSLGTLTFEDRQLLSYTEKRKSSRKKE